MTAAISMRWLTTATNALNQASSFRYDHGIGKPVYATDINRQTTDYNYGNDPLDRLLQVTLPNRGDNPLQLSEHTRSGHAAGPDKRRRPRA